MQATIPLTQFKTAAEAAERAWQEARAKGSLAEAAAAQVALAVARLELGELEAVQGLASEAIVACDDAGLASERLLAEAVLGLARVQAGRLAEAAAALVRLEERWPYAAPEAVAAAAPYAVGAIAGLGRLDRALGVAQEALFMHRSLELPELRTSLEVAMAEVQAHRGAWDAAREFAGLGAEAASSQNARGTLARALRVKALAALHDKQGDEARRAADQAFSVASQQGALYQAALAAGMQAEGLRAQSDPEALARFEAMAGLADQVGAPALKALALAGQARASNAPGRSAEARRLLEGLAAGLSGEDAQAFLGLPAHAAVLTLESAVPAAPGLEDHQAMLDLLVRANADLQGVTTQYGRLFQEWSAKGKRLEVLNELASTVSASLDLDTVLSRVMDLTLDLTQAQRCFVLFKEAGHYEGLLVRAARDVSGKDIKDARFSLSICMRVHTSGEQTTILDASGLGGDLTQSIQALSLQTVMCVPLSCREKRLGVIYVDSQAAVKTFSQDDLTLLGAIANHAAVAIDNALMYESLNARTAELERTLTRAREAEHAATTDTLTGLRNRRYLQELAVRELDIARRYDRDLTAVFFDLDAFAGFNERHGRGTGDQALAAVAGVLVQHLRAGDLPARVGGDEVLILCPSTSPSEAASLAERLRGAIGELRIPAGDATAGDLRATFGIASVKQGAATLDELFARADAALMAGKQGGRDQVQVWQPPV